MADEIKVFIRTEQLADHNGHLSCIATGHRQYTKDTWLEPIKGLETLSAYKDTLERLLANVKNVVLCSSHECSVRSVTSSLSRH